ncbi:MAG: efflux RND transporter periplasmic adaptor subunit [Acidobacteriota bacterium]
MSLASFIAERRVTLGAFGLFAVGLGLVSVVTSAPGDATGADAEVPLPVEVLTVTRVDGYAVRRELVGRIEARRESPVGFELGGLVTSIAVDEGDTVDAGQVLARLDTRRLRARRGELVAARDQAQADLELATLTLQRIREASDLDAVSPQARDEAELGLRVREATVARAVSALDSLDVELDKSRLLAPFAGIVGRRFADEGRVIAAGEPVLQLLETQRPEARIGIAGPAVDTLGVGQRHALSVRGRSVDATLRALLPTRDQGTRSVDAVFVLDGELDGLRSGDLARLSVDTRIDEGGFWLPFASLTEGNRGLWAAYVAAESDPDGSDPDSSDPIGGEGISVLERRPLELLYQETDRAFVRGALVNGERVVASGLHRLVPGQRVRPVLSDGPSAPDGGAP